MRLIDADAFKNYIQSGLEDVRHLFKDNGKLAEKVIEGICEDIDEQPTAEPSWIPCSERLPDELGVVNVTYVNHDPEPYYDFVKDMEATDTAVYYRGDWYWNWSGCVDVLAEYGRDDANKVDKAVEVIAWKPLPAPYKGE